MQEKQSNLSSLNNQKTSGPHTYKVLIIDLVGMILDENGQADFSEVAKHISLLNGQFHLGSIQQYTDQGYLLSADYIHFFYQPNLSRSEEILIQTRLGEYDAVIAAATFIPGAAKFSLGGVRIGAGTGNMGADIWGGGSGKGGKAVLMNTPSFNSRATAQSAFKAILKVLPDLQVEKMHNLVVKGDFDTGKDLSNYPTTKLEGKRLAIIGYGNIGREMAKLGAAFGMQVVIYARSKHQKWIESEGFEYAKTIIDAAKNADIISPHTGLGTFDNKTNRFENAGIINASVFSVMNQNSLLINYDRGEVVDIYALDEALVNGQIRYAAIDADLFKDPITNELSGPMVPYRGIYHRHPNKMELLPHAAADTEHISRVEGAKQAVNQIFDLILNKRVTNLIGDLPEVYKNAGAKTVNGVGKVVPSNLSSLNKVQLEQLATLANDQAVFWKRLATNDLSNENLLANQGEDIILKVNQYTTLLKNLGLQGPYQS